MPKTAILIPYRQGDSWREKAWGFVRCWYGGDLLEPDNFLMASDSAKAEIPYAGGDRVGALRKFNRSESINTAASLVSHRGYDVYLICDADTFVMLDQVRLAIDVAHKTGLLTHAFTSWHGLNEAGSRLVYAGKLPAVNWSRMDWRRYAPESVNLGVSSCLAVPRSLFEEVGGFDERFIGWGYEDHAFYEACRTFGGGSLRVPGEAWHLFHAPARERTAAIQPTSANRQLVERYRQASGDRESMMALLKERA